MTKDAARIHALYEQAFKGADLHDRQIAADLSTWLVLDPEFRLYLIVAVRGDVDGRLSMSVGELRMRLPRLHPGGLVTSFTDEELTQVVSAGVSIGLLDRSSTPERLQLSDAVLTELDAA